MGTFRHMQFAFYVITLLLLVHESEQAGCTEAMFVAVNGRFMTCADAVKYVGQTTVCVTSSLKSSCCKTCDQLKNQGNTDAACTDATLIIINGKTMNCPQAIEYSGPSFVCATSTLKGKCCTSCTQWKQKNLGNTSPSGKLIAEGYFVFDRKSLDIYMREENNDFAKAKASLLYDFNFFLHSVNSLYKTMNQYGLDIELYIAQTEVLTRDIFLPSQLASDGSISQDASSHKFQSYLKSSKALSNTMYDFAVLMTGYQITGALGFAARDTMCQLGKAVAVVEASATMASVRTLTHEIGHLFGSDHDASNTVYIMAPKLNINYDPLQFTFSGRSAGKIKNYLDNDPWRTWCLKSWRPTSKAPTVTPDTYTGKLQDANVICQRHVGPTSHVCTSTQYYNGSLTGDKMCYMIGCRNMTNMAGCTYVIPTEGMPCAQDKACKTGKCVVDAKPNTKNVDTNCPWGDDPYMGGSLTGNCAYVMRNGGGQACVRPEISSGCCATCQKLKTNNPACPYGDQRSVNVNGQSMSCDQIIQTYGTQPVCGKPSFNKICCQTCADLRKGNPASCPYGDSGKVNVNSESITCAQSISMYGYQWTCKDSVTVRKSCCKTCLNGGDSGTSSSQSSSGSPSTVVCKDNTYVILNDKQMTCAEAVQVVGPTIVCVTSKMKGQCCNTCDQLKQKNQGNTACPYGDVGSFLFQGQTTRTKCDKRFMKLYCPYDTFKSACCNFCSQP